MIRNGTLRGTHAPVALLLCLAAAGAYREVGRILRPEPASDPVSLAVARFEDMKDSLPERGELCFVSEPDPLHSGSAPLFLAQYALAPLVVKVGDECDLLLGEFDDSQLAAALRKSGAQVLRRDGGLTLLRRRRP